MGKLAPWTERAIRMIYESPTPIARELVLYEAGLLIPPTVAHRRAVRILVRDRETGDYRSDGKKVGRRIDITADHAYLIDTGRRDLVRENLNELRKRGRIRTATLDGVVYYEAGPKPLEIKEHA